MLGVFLTSLCRFGVGFVLLVAGAGKVRAVEEFGEAVRGYRLLPESAVALFARALPFVEMLVGLALVFGVVLRLAGAVAAALLAAFSAAVSVNLLRGREIDCGCFNLLGKNTISWWIPARNAVVLLGALYLSVYPGRALSVRGGSDQSSVVVAGAVFAALLLAVVNLSALAWSARRRLDIVSELEATA